MLDRGGRTESLIRIGVAVVATLALLYLPYYYEPYRVFQFTLVLVYAVAVLGLNMLTGYSGQISLGHSAFFAAGAYISAILMQRYGINYLLTIPAAAAVNFGLGFLFGVPALRLHGLYLALVTLSLAVATPPLIKRFEEFTGGSQGLVLSKPEPPLWTGLAEDQWLYFITLAVTVVMFVLGRNLLRGRIGHALLALRDDGIAAQTMGIDLAHHKTLAFAYSAMYAGVAGALYTFSVGFVSPESFTLVQALGFLTAVVVGGLATITGAILGALFIQFVPVFAADINEALSGFLYGVILIMFMFIMPGGAVGLLRKLLDRVLELRSPVAGAGPRAPETVPAPSAGGSTRPAVSKTESEYADRRS